MRSGPRSRPDRSVPPRRARIRFLRSETSADGTGTAERLTDGTLLTFPDTVTPDGKSLIVQQRDAKGQWALNVVSLAGSHDVTALLAKPFNEQLADLSPDGKWIAYESDESG